MFDFIFDNPFDIDEDRVYENYFRLKKRGGHAGVEHVASTIWSECFSNTVSYSECFSNSFSVSEGVTASE